MQALSLTEDSILDRKMEDLFDLGKVWKSFSFKASYIKISFYLN